MKHWDHYVRNGDLIQAKYLHAYEHGRKFSLYI